jgi:hypothetical protein
MKSRSTKPRTTFRPVWVSERPRMSATRPMAFSRASETNIRRATCQKRLTVRRSKRLLVS